MSRAQLAEKFAASRGWKLIKGWLSVEQLRAGRRCRPVSMHSDHPVLDHIECFVDANRRPAAILTHSYAKWPAIEAWAAQHGLMVERLPFSWYYRGTIAAVFTDPYNDPLIRG